MLRRSQHGGDRRRGFTWVSAPITGYTFLIPVGAAPDHSLRIAAIHQSGATSELQLLRVDAAEGAKPLDPPVLDIKQSSYGDGFAVTEDGAAWILAKRFERKKGLVDIDGGEAGDLFL